MMNLTFTPSATLHAKLHITVYRARIEKFSCLQNFELVIFWIRANLPKIKGTGNFPLLNFFLMHGVTGLPFVVAIAYGIQLLERKPHNAADRYHSNQYCVYVASNRKRLTVERLFDIVVENFSVFNFRMPAGHLKILEHQKFPGLWYTVHMYMYVKSRLGPVCRLYTP